MKILTFPKKLSHIFDIAGRKALQNRQIPLQSPDKFFDGSSSF